MRTLTAHKVNPANDRLTIEVTDEPGAGGACHRYEISGYDAESQPTFDKHMDAPSGVTILFQNGPIAEVGVNGVTQEALLAIIADRLECFQRGPYACADNAEALGHVRAAMEVLHRRTKTRMAAGVEGTHEKGPESVSWSCSGTDL